MKLVSECCNVAALFPLGEIIYDESVELDGVIDVREVVHHVGICSDCKDNAVFEVEELE